MLILLDKCRLTKKSTQSARKTSTQSVIFIYANEMTFFFFLSLCVGPSRTLSLEAADEAGV